MRPQVTPSEVPRWDAVALLRSRHTGRLCVIDHGTPIALPVTFRADGTDAELRIVVRGAATGLLARSEGPASFQVDDIDEEQLRAWSVLARGTLRHAQGETLPDPRPWVAGDRPRWLVLDVAAITARRFTGAVSSDGYAVEWSLDPEPTDGA